MGESGAGLTLCVDNLSCAHIGWLARGVTGWTFGSKCLKILQVMLFWGSNHNVQDGGSFLFLFLSPDDPSLNSFRTYIPVWLQHAVAIIVNLSWNFPRSRVL